MNSQDECVLQSRTIDCTRLPPSNLMPSDKIPSARFRRPKLMSNHRVMQKLFPVYRTIDADIDTTHNRKPQSSKYRPKLTDEQIFRLLLTRQRQKYEQILCKLNIPQKLSYVQVDNFLGGYE